MTNTSFYLRRWLPVPLWMVVIFIASTDIGSNAHTSLIIDPILHFLFGNNLLPATIDNVHFFVRKTAHLTEYAVLGALLWNALAARPPVANGAEPVSGRSRGRAAWLAVLAAGLYASSDEFHQSFVPSRTASPRDVMIDTTGAAVGVLLLWLWSRYRLKRAAARRPLPAEA